MIKADDTSAWCLPPAGLYVVRYHLT